MAGTPGTRWTLTMVAAYSGGHDHHPQTRAASARAAPESERGNQQQQKGAGDEEVQLVDREDARDQPARDELQSTALLASKQHEQPGHAPAEPTRSSRWARFGSASDTT